MHIHQIKVEGFGTLAQVSLSELGSGLNVIHGVNGSGKTTILHFLRGMLCGFGDARRLRLIPPLRGGRPGGSLSVTSAGNRFDVIRHARPDHLDTLAVHLQRGLAEDVARLRKELHGLNADVVCKVFAVGGAESLDLSGLVQLALQQGIDLSSQGQSGGWVAHRVREIELERGDLFRGSPPSGRLAELEHRRRDLGQKIEEERGAQLSRSQEWHQTIHPLREAISRRQQEIDWLCQELQGVETDLSEVQNRLWSSRHVNFVQPAAPSSPPEVETPSAWREELQIIDGEMSHAQQMLRDLAAARCRLSLAGASLAGAAPEDPMTAWQRQRALLKTLEENAEALSRSVAHLPHSRSEDRVAAALDGIRHQIWLMCQEIGQHQSAHERLLMSQDRAGIDRCEEEVLAQIDRLRKSRERLIPQHASAADRIASRSPHEAAGCECAGHSEAVHGLPDHSKPKSIPQAAKGVQSRALPGDTQRETELFNKRNQLRRQLMESLDRLRLARAELEERERLGPQPAFSSSLQTLKHEYAVIEQQLADGREQWESLALLQTVLQRTQKRLEEPVASPVLADAGRRLQQMTQGKYLGYRYEPAAGELRIINSVGGELGPASLSRGTLEQAVLCFRLALCREFDRRGIHLPLILDDILADSDEERVRAAIEMLMEFSQEHQVLLFTCQHHLATLFEAAGATVRDLPGSQRLREIAPAEPASARPSPSSTPPSDPRTVLRRDRIQPDDPHWLQPDSPVSYVPSLGAQMARRLGALGVRTIADLIDLDPEVAEIPLDSLQISAATLRHWQSEARLLCCVADLTGRDAQLLVACGIMSPSELAQVDLEDLSNRIRRLCREHQSDLALPWLNREGDSPSRDQLSRWIQCGRSARVFQRTRAATLEKKGGPRSGAAVMGGSRGASRTAVRLRSAGQVPRLYLSPESPVVDAPSIGPRMAERLGTIGILTVANLLQRNAWEISQRLGRRDISPQVVAAWQHQARLMCHIPGLRGHDAQLLVACGIQEVDDVASRSIDDLFGLVEPMAASREGQRILRSAKAPNREEVAGWIENARAAQTARAA